MRAPYFQVPHEWREQVAEDVAVALGCAASKVFTGMYDLMTWALGRAPDDAPPSLSAEIADAGASAALLIARAMGFPRSRAEALTEALCACRPAILEKTERGYRVLFLATLDSMWLKNRTEAERVEWSERLGRAGKKGNRTGTAPEPSGVASEPSLQTQTQTQKPPETSAPSARMLREDSPKPWAVFLQRFRETREASPRGWMSDAPDVGKVQEFVRMALLTAVERGLARDEPQALERLCRAYQLYVERRTDLDPQRAPWRFFREDVFDLLARAAEGRPAVDPPSEKRSRDSPPKDVTKGVVRAESQHFEQEAAF